MRRASEVKAFLQERGLTLLGPIISSPNEDFQFYAFVEVVFDATGRQIPNAHRLNTIATEAADHGTTIHFVLIENEKEHLDRSIKTMLLGNFSADIRNSFAAIGGDHVDIWIEPKRSLSPSQCEAIEAKARDFLRFLDLTLRSFKITRAENVPTATATLRALRAISPASAGALRVALQKRGFVVPNEVWLNHMLDKLRKAGHVVRKANEDYILSLQGLAVLGTRKSRSSPDVERALALGRGER